MRGAALEIVLYRQILIQHGVLKNHTRIPLDAVGVAVQIDAADLNGSGILGKLPAHDVDGGGFACSVDAQEGEQLAFFDTKAQIVYRLHIDEAFAQA